MNYLSSISSITLIWLLIRGSGTAQGRIFQLPPHGKSSEFLERSVHSATAGLDTIFVQINMDALPGVPGVSKNQIFFTNKTVEFLR